MEGFLKEKLEERKNKGLLRRVVEQEKLIDFLSNDYLGLGKNEELFNRINSKIESSIFSGNGGTGSRLLAGNHVTYSKLESYLRKLFRAEASLVFNSGYSANQGLVAAVAGKGDTIIYDQLAHICLKEGAWLSRAQSFSFRHNDLQELESRLSNATGQIFVITESVFSMDGDESPIAEIIAMCKKYDAHLIVDEAHSTGTFGEAGSGWLCEKGVEQEVFARIYTFGKGMGVHGGCVAGSQLLIDYLVNFARTFIYSTSLPPHSIVSIEESFRYLADHQELQNQLRAKIELFKSGMNTLSNSSIQPVLIQGNREARKVANELQNKGYDIRPILAPTVKEGTERLRISLHTYNSDEEIISLTSHLNQLTS